VNNVAVTVTVTGANGQWQVPAIVFAIVDEGLEGAGLNETIEVGAPVLVAVLLIPFAEGPIWFAVVDAAAATSAEYTSSRNPGFAAI
jgi:hypothetical protein